MECLYFILEMSHVCTCESKHQQSVLGLQCTCTYQHTRSKDVAQYGTIRLTSNATICQNTREQYLTSSTYMYVETI